jgi:ferrous iron transport protein A
MTLGELKVGDSGRVLSLSQANREYRRRLLAMGLLPGTEFAVTRVAPLGDPLELRVRGFNLSLRKEEAAAITVERIGS